MRCKLICHLDWLEPRARRVKPYSYLRREDVLLRPEQCEVSKSIENDILGLQINRQRKTHLVDDDSVPCIYARERTIG